MTGYIIIALIAVLAFVETVHYVERKDLYDRLMCRNMEEYKKRNDPQPKIKTAHQKAIDKWRGEKE